MSRVAALLIGLVAGLVGAVAPVGAAAPVTTPVTTPIPTPGNVPARTQQRAQDLHAGITSVEVFANMAMQITPAASVAAAQGYQLSIYRLDAMQNLEQMAGAGMPREEAAARRWLKDNEPRIRRQVQPFVASAVNGVMLARKYRIERIPAMVINRRYVVFGTTDVDQALAMLLARQRK